MRDRRQHGARAARTNVCWLSRLAMALNVPTVVDSSGRVLPQPFPGEVFMLQRSKVECELKDATGKWKSVKGELYLTSLRLAFVTDPKELPKSRFISIEFPLQGIWDEALNQPIFGCNNVSGTSQYYEDQPFDGTLMFKLYFLHGGVGTFVPRLNFALQQVRASMQQSGQGEFHSLVCALLCMPFFFLLGLGGGARKADPRICVLLSDLSCLSSNFQTQKSIRTALSSLRAAWTTCSAQHLWTQATRRLCTQCQTSRVSPIQATYHEQT